MANPGKDYLKEYDAAPEAEKYPLVQGWMRSEPLAFFKQLRAERPVLQTPECTLVAMFTDVRDMLQMRNQLLGWAAPRATRRHWSPATRKP